MKILWLNCNTLFPLTRGGNIRTYNILNQLNQDHSITYLSYFDDIEISEEELRKKMRLCAKTQIYIKKNWEKKFSFRFYLSLFRNLFSTYPYIISKYRSKAMINRVDSLLKQNRYDVIICDFLHSSIFLPKIYRRISVLFQHNVESVIRERQYRNETNLLKKWYLNLQWRKLLKYEKRVCREFRACIAVSPEDEKMLKDFGAKQTRVIQTGVDTVFFSPSKVEEKPCNLVFTGSMDWLPNEDAVVYFANSIFPKIKRELPHSTFTIVGRNPGKKVKALQEQNTSIEVTGTVDDVRPYINRASVYIVPLRVGGGTRIKIFEAMSMGKAVVSTSIGAEGLEVQNGENIVIADSSDAFAEKTIELLNNLDKRRQIGQTAKTLVTQKFSSDIVAKEFEYICKEFIINLQMAC